MWMVATTAPWHLDARLWVAVPMVLFLLFLISRGVYGTVLRTLDLRADNIRAELDEARRLREEAQVLLASYHRQQKSAEAEAEQIILQARRDAEAMAAQARQDLTKKLLHRQAQAETKIAHAEAMAVQGIRAHVIERAIDISQALMATQMRDTDHRRLVEEAIANIDKTFN